MRFSPKLLTAAHAKVDRLLAEGIVEPSESPWSSCPVIASKEDGSIWFCIDYRQLNKITKKDAYLLPHMDSSLDNLGNANYLSKIDLRQVYHQIICRKSICGKSIIKLFVENRFAASLSSNFFGRI